MAEDHKRPWRDKPSINYRCGSLRGRRGSSFEIVDFSREDHVSSPTGDKQKSRTFAPRDSQICSTRELISALGSIWNNITGPLSILVPKSPSRYESPYLKECNILWYFSEDRRLIAVDNHNHPISLMEIWGALPVVSGHLGFIKVKDKISFIQPSSGINSLLRELLCVSDLIIPEPSKQRNCSNVGLERDLHKVYGGMTGRAISNQEHPVNFTGMDKYDDGHSDMGLTNNDPAYSCIPVGGSGSAPNLIIESRESCDEETKLACISLGQSDVPNSTMKASCATLWSDHATAHGIESSSGIPNSSLCADSVGPHASSRAYDIDEREISGKVDLEGHAINHQQNFAVDKTSKAEVCFLTKQTPNRPIARQEHAFAGALAGVFVSLSLHPVDTVKTVVQSCHADQRSLLDICRSIISQRGITGLYRGIATNIASSAPISALYTFTYESMKGIFLPFLPMEYQSVGLCMAGGCASIATSFIFTPSERIKQQMQVGSRYQNCWNAFLGVVEKGGLSSLYTGWGAVLCRNIPHSVIKFYTYESMKTLLSSVRLDGQTNATVTLVSGGLAASTAALFTTPFDVVKTRFQTRIPGPLNRYPGVFDTLKEIAITEGFKGLYRGLTPRLFMYMTQGALFFASYESFKKLLSLDGSQINFQAIGHGEIDDDLQQDEDRIM